MAQQSPEEVAAARRIMACKDFIPLPLRFLIFLLIIIVYQFSGGVYMTAVTQMAGAMAWLTEDIMMAGYASLVGLTVAFPLLFRLMFRFTARSLLLVSTAVLIFGDVICMYSDWVPLVVFVSFVCGVFKMIGTFICWSNIQLNITPTRDFAVFSPFLFTFVLGCVQLSNIGTGYSIWAYDWQTMHLFTIEALLLIGLMIHITMRRHFRQGPYIPFLGIDYLGGVLWSLFLIDIVFICVYGEHYDWWRGEEIRIATVFAALLLLMSLHRGATVRHPFIRLETFVQHNMLNIFILFGGMTLMSATSGGLQNIYTGSILHYDTFHTVTLNWGSFWGVLFGAGFSYMGLVRWKWRNKYVVFIGFVFFTLYQLMLYFLIDASTDKEMLYLPMFCKGAGLCIVYTVLTYTLACNVPFIYYFEAMCVIGFMRTSIGNPMSSALVTRAFNCIKQKNWTLLSSEMDGVNLWGEKFSTLYNELQRQVLLVSLKEVYGYAIWAGLLILILILLSDYRGHFTAQIPKMATLWKMIKKGES